MFISGIFFGDTAETCYLGVFPTGFADSDLVIVGNLFTRNYYLVYDMTPLEMDEDYI